METASCVEPCTASLPSSSSVFTSAALVSAVKQRILDSLSHSEDHDQVTAQSFDAEECYLYVVNTLGENHQIPALLNIKDGTDCMLEVLQRRYGDYRSQYDQILERHLRKQGTGESDERLWRQWRADFHETGVSVFMNTCVQDLWLIISQNFATPAARASQRSRVLSWDSGDTKAFPEQPTLKREQSSGSSFLAEGEEAEFENRVDLANGSKPAIGLRAAPTRAKANMKKTVGSLFRPEEYSEAQTPWE